jgi:hypothetical protein
MISFRQFLNEVFNRPLPYTKEYSAGKSGSYKFALPDSDLEVYVTIRKLLGQLNHASDRIDVSFSIGGPNQHTTYSMTNQNKYQIAIMATVVDIVRQHIKDNPLNQHDYVEFSAKNKDHGRVALYKRLANGLAKEMNAKVTVGSSFGSTDFRIIKT